MMVVGVSVIAVGLSPWDLYPSFHDGFALLQAAAQWVAMILIAVCAGRGPFRKLTSLALVISVAGFVAFMAALEGLEVPWVGLGGAERLSFDTLTIWTALTGIVLLKARGRGQPHNHES